MAWRREDTFYAAATLAAVGLVLYFVVANFGLVPSPLAPRGPLGGAAIGVPTLPGGPAPAAAPAPTPGRGAAAAVPSPSAPPVTPSPTRAAAAADRTPPSGRITTADGMQTTVTEPATVDGTASDNASGVASVVVTFTPAAGAPTDATARLACPAPTRRSCTWSVDVPAVAGRYVVVAKVTDRAANSSETAPITITVVNVGGAVTTVTNLLGGVTSGVLRRL